MSSNDSNNACEDVSDTPCETYLHADVGQNVRQIHRLSSDGKPIAYSILDDRGYECVRVVVQHKSIDNTDILSLSQVMYRPTCPIEDSRQRGLQTVIMVKTLLAAVMSDTTEYDRVYVTDTSEIVCILPNEDDVTFRVLLGLLLFITEGKTWYQKQYGAEIASDKFRNKMDHADRLLEEQITTSKLQAFTDALNNALGSYKTEQWNIDAKRVADNILAESVGKSWRSLLSDLFSAKGLLATSLGENISCVLLEILHMDLNDLFDLPNMTMIPSYILRETILSYPEMQDMKITVDQLCKTKRKDMSNKLSYAVILNGIPLYTIGGKNTLRLRRIRPIPPEYGRNNIFGYMWRRRQTRNKTRKFIGKTTAILLPK
jgi:hypothetical protein